MKTQIKYVFKLFSHLVFWPNRTHRLGKLGCKLVISTTMLTAFREKKTGGLEVNAPNKSVIKKGSGKKAVGNGRWKDRRSWRVSDHGCWCDQLMGSTPWHALMKGLFEEQGYREVGSQPCKNITGTSPGILGNSTPHTAGQTNHSSFCSDLDRPHDLHKNTLAPWEITWMNCSHSISSSRNLLHAKSVCHAFKPGYTEELYCFKKTSSAQYPWCLTKLYWDEKVHVRMAYHKWVWEVS